jgi:hypothetical protein
VICGVNFIFIGIIIPNRYIYIYIYIIPMHDVVFFLLCVS